MQVFLTPANTISDNFEVSLKPCKTAVYLLKNGLISECSLLYNSEEYIKLNVESSILRLKSSNFITCYSSSLARDFELNLM